jgi:hypothetical protein
MPMQPSTTVKRFFDGSRFLTEYDISAKIEKTDAEKQE